MPDENERRRVELLAEKQLQKEKLEQTALDAARQEYGTILRLESEADKAARHKQALSNVMTVVVAVAEEARRDGFYVEFGLGLDQFGRYVINPPAAILKRY